MEAPREKTTAVKATEMAKKVIGMVKQHYARAREAKEREKPIAWAMVLRWGQREILNAFDIATLWPEHYGAYSAAKMAVLPFVEKAEAEGFSNCICGYCRNCLGFGARRQELGMMPADAAGGGLTDPDILVFSTWACDSRYKWFKALTRYYDVPHYCLDIVIPLEDMGKEAEERYIRYQVNEYRNLIAFLERQTQKKLNLDRLEEVTEDYEEMVNLWRECYELRKAVPSPMPSQDMFACQFPGMFMSAEKETLQFFRDLRDELKYRVENKIAAIPQEKYRLLFGHGLPPWHHMDIFNYFERHGGVHVVEFSYYYEAYCPEVEVYASDPLERIVRRAYKRAFWSLEKAKKEFKRPLVHPTYGYVVDMELLQAVRDYKIDGMVCHFPKSCRLTPLGQLHSARLLREYAKIPTLFIESDIIDPRDYAEAHTKANIDAFMETIASAKGE